MAARARIISSTKYVLRWILLLSILLVLGLLTTAVITQSRGQVRFFVLLTGVGLVVGALLADINVGGLRRFPRTAGIALAAIILSQLFYLLLVWTGFKTESLPWRIWWLSMVASVTITHGLVLRQASANQKNSALRGTLFCVLVTGGLIAALGLRRHLVGGIGPFYQGMMTLPLVGAFVGSVYVWIRWARDREKPARRPMSRGATIAWLCGSHVVLLVAGVYIGRVGTSSEIAIRAVPSALRGLSPQALEDRIRDDLVRMKKVLVGMDELDRNALAFQVALRERMSAENRGYYLPEEEHRIQWYFVEFLTLRDALLRLATIYAGYEAVSDPDARAQCFMLGYTATIGSFHAGLNFTHAYGERPEERRKLNEPEPKWGLRAGLFDEVEESVSSGRSAELCAEMGAYFQLNRDRWRGAGIFATQDFDWLEGRIARGEQFVSTHRVNRSKAWLERIVVRVRQDTYRPVYAAQSLLAELIGDTRIAEREPYVAIDLIEQEVAPKLRPGDIILERRNWFLSNAFLPGFWPHGALYVGTMDDLRELDIADAPEIRRHAEAFLELADDGRPRTVIEAVSEGVVFNSLTHSMHADYVAVLRPRLTEEQIGEAIRRAFSHYGKDYDFEFDFFTADKLVCTELVYRAYQGMLDFQLVPVMGRDTFPALEMVRKFASERNRREPELEFVLFLDANPATGKAEFASEDVFCASVDRPQAFVE